jgi:hypothetical protein
MLIQFKERKIKNKRSKLLKRNLKKSRKEQNFKFRLKKKQMKRKKQRGSKVK